MQDRPINLIRDGYATHGDVFTVPVAHKRITYLVGSDASAHFFRASDDELSQTEVRWCRGSIPGLVSSQLWGKAGGSSTLS